MDRPVLHYNGVTLTGSDLESLQNESGWLTDNIISFAYTFFENETYRDFKEDFEFIVPSVVQLLKLCPVEDLREILTTMKLHEQNKRLELKVQQCPQQKNTSDCGIFVILVTKAICDEYKRFKCKIGNQSHDEQWVLHFMDDKIADIVQGDVLEQGRKRLFNIIVNHMQRSPPPL
ncbi:hypothetical protein ACOME3_008678 [Neoechinorhynchus agilis]